MTRAPIARLATAIAALLVVATADVRAESCTGVTGSGGRFATCFDVGNRLSLTAGSDGFGGSIAVRHAITFDDEPDLAWKLEHQGLDVTHATFEDRLVGTVYRGKFLRHARDGHIVIPLGRTPKKIFLPFDVGGMADVGRLEWRPGSSEIQLGIVRVAALIDVARTRSFRRRLAFGPVARWDVDVDRDSMKLAQHAVTPFTAGLATLRAETANGRTIATVDLEAGATWRSDGVGWGPDARADASLERILLAINDRPIALTFGVRYQTATDEAIARVGARVVLVQRRDPRVQVDLHRSARHPLVRR
jgi:hypothetical protein